MRVQPQASGGAEQGVAGINEQAGSSSHLFESVSPEPDETRRSPNLNSPTVILTPTPGDLTLRTEEFFTEAMRQVTFSDVKNSTLPHELMAYDDSDTVIMNHPS